MMKKASTIWSKETGIDRNPADQVEVFRPDDQRERYLSIEEMRSLKAQLDAEDVSGRHQGHQPDVLSVARDCSDQITPEWNRLKISASEPVVSSATVRD